MAHRPIMEDRRDFRAFLGAMRAAPGFWLRVLAVAFFAGSLATTKGIKAAIEAVLLGVVVLVGVGYPLFRRRGRLP